MVGKKGEEREECYRLVFVVVNLRVFFFQRGRQRESEKVVVFLIRGRLYGVYLGRLVWKGMFVKLWLSRAMIRLIFVYGWVFRVKFWCWVFCRCCLGESRYKDQIRSRRDASRSFSYSRVEIGGKGVFRIVREQRFSGEGLFYGVF